MTDLFAGNLLLPWPVLLELAESANHLERKEALSQARVHAARFLKDHGIDASEGKVQEALREAVRQGIVDETKLPEALRALRVRNWLQYHTRSVSPESIREAVLALYEIFNDKSDRDARANALRERLMLEAGRSQDTSLKNMVETLIGVAVLAGVVKVAAKGAREFDRMLMIFVVVVVASAVIYLIIYTVNH